MTRNELDALVDAILSIRSKVDDDTALEHIALYPKWKPEVEYALGERFVYDGVLYKANQLHTSSELYSPAVQSSLYSRVLAVEGQISEWEQPDSTNAYMTGDKVIFNGVVYESLIDNNIWSPSDYPDGWREG